MTETHPVASSGVLPKRYADADDATKADQRSRAGIPFLGVEARIVDADTLEPQPWDDKATGELQVRGPWCAQDYYNPDAGVRAHDRRRLDEDRRRRGHGRVRLDPHRRPHQGPDQVRRRVDQLGRPGERDHEPPGGEGGRGHRHPATRSGTSGRWPASSSRRARRRPRRRSSTHLKPLVAKWWLPEAVEFIDEVPKTSVGKFSKKDLRANSRSTSSRAEDLPRPETSRRTVHAPRTSPRATSATPTTSTRLAVSTGTEATSHGRRPTAAACRSRRPLSLTSRNPAAVRVAAIPNP